MSKLRAIGYVRVSTMEQVNHGSGLEIQEDAITGYCRRQGLRLVRVARDEGESGANGLETREGLALALAELERGDADVLVVYRLDRLARDLLLQETIIQRLAARGHKTRAGDELSPARVVSVSEPDVDSEEPARVMVRQIFGVLSQYERAVIRARLSAGKRVKRAKGADRFLGGHAPFGWRIESHELVPVPEEQREIKRALRMREKGRSLREIATDLERRGVKPRSRGAWHATQVKRVLEHT